MVMESWKKQYVMACTKPVELSSRHKRSQRLQLYFQHQERTSDLRLTLEVQSNIF